MHRPLTNGCVGSSRNCSGIALAQVSLADSAVELDATAALVYRAAWTKDGGTPRIACESSIAKAFATKAAHAQRIAPDDRSDVKSAGIKCVSNDLFASPG
jgi:Acyl-CoA dehydrogenase, C-terminal domain